LVIRRGSRTSKDRFFRLSAVSVAADVCQGANVSWIPKTPPRDVVEVTVTKLPPTPRVPKVSTKGIGMPPSEWTPPTGRVPPRPDPESERWSSPVPGIAVTACDDVAIVAVPERPPSIQSYWMSFPNTRTRINVEP
jgi:hypothetical protein